MKKTSILSFGVAAALTLSAHAQSKLAPVSISLVRETTVGYYGASRLLSQPGLPLNHYNTAGVSSAARVTNANIVASALALKDAAFAPTTGGWSLQALPIVDNGADFKIVDGGPTIDGVADKLAPLSHYIVAVHSGTTKFLLLGKLSVGYTTTFLVKETAATQSGTLRYQGNASFSVISRDAADPAEPLVEPFVTAYNLANNSAILETDVDVLINPEDGTEEGDAGVSFVAALNGIAGAVSASVAIVPTGTAVPRVGKFVHASTRVAPNFSSSRTDGGNSIYDRYSGGISIGKSDYVR